MPYITKNGQTMKVVEDALPMWIADGWAQDSARVGVPDKSLVTAALATDLVIAATTATDVVTLTLPVGTWLVAPTVTLLGPTAATVHDIGVVVTAGTASLLGPVVASVTAAAAGTLTPVNFDVLITVTVAATVKMRVYSGAGGSTAKAKGAQGPFTTATATGMTAVRVA